MGLIKAPKDFDEFYDSANTFKDELLYKLLISQKTYPMDDLLTYLLDREEDMFFQMSEWKQIAKLRGIEKDGQEVYNDKTRLMAVLVDVIYDIQNSDEFRSFLSLVVHGEARSKNELLKQKQKIESNN